MAAIVAFFALFAAFGALWLASDASRRFKDQVEALVRARVRQVEDDQAALERDQRKTNDMVAVLNRKIGALENELKDRAKDIGDLKVALDAVKTEAAAVRRVAGPAPRYTGLGTPPGDGGGKPSN